VLGRGRCRRPAHSSRAAWVEPSVAEARPGRQPRQCRDARCRDTGCRVATWMSRCDRMPPTSMNRQLRAAAPAVASPAVGVATKCPQGFFEPAFLLTDGQVELVAAAPDRGPVRPGPAARGRAVRLGSAPADPCRRPCSGRPRAARTIGGSGSLRDAQAVATGTRTATSRMAGPEDRSAVLAGGWLRSFAVRDP